MDSIKYQMIMEKSIEAYQTTGAILLALGGAGLLVSLCTKAKRK